MKKSQKVWIAIAITVALLGQMLTWGFVFSMKDELIAMGKKGVHYVISFGDRINHLEDREDEEAIPIIGEEESRQNDVMTEEAASAVDTNDGYDATETNSCEQESHTAHTQEQVSKPTDNGEDLTASDIRDTLTEAVTESVTQADVLPTENYRVGIYEGIIGVFDVEGVLVDSCNVFVMTLPQADREALREGIWVSTMDEALDILEKYA